MMVYSACALILSMPPSAKCGIETKSQFGFMRFEHPAEVKHRRGHSFLDDNEDVKGRERKPSCQEGRRGGPGYAAPLVVATPHDTLLQRSSQPPSQCPFGRRELLLTGGCWGEDAR